MLSTLRRDQLLEAHHLVSEELIRQLIQPVTHVGIEQIVGDHGVEELARDLDAVAEQYLQVVFEVLPDLERARGGKERTQALQKGEGGATLGGDVEVIGAAIV